MTPRGLFNPNAPFHLPQSTFLQYDLLLCVQRVLREVGGGWGWGREVSGLSSSLIMRDDVSVSSARLPCVIGVGFCEVGEG